MQDQVWLAALTGELSFRLVMTGGVETGTCPSLDTSVEAFLLGVIEDMCRESLVAHDLMGGKFQC